MNMGQGNTTVAAAHVRSYDPGEVQSGLAEVLGLVGRMEAFVQPGERVLIKPNMLEALAPAKAVTTHPEVVRAVIRSVKAAGGFPVVGDSPAMGNTLKTAKRTGILQVCQDEGAEVALFQEGAGFFWEKGITVKKFSLAKELGEVDKVISVAKMKTHSFTGITGGIKNLFGFVVGTDKAQFHMRMQRRSDFAAMLVDLACVVKPVLYIVDGITAMEGSGPRNGLPIKADVIIAGENGFAVDMVMAEMMGFHPETLPVAAKALARGLTPRFSDILILGSAKELRLRFKAPKNLEALEDRIPKWAAEFARQQLTAKPTIRDCCTGCGRCVAHCPPKAMKVADDKAGIDHHLCIRCYCCQEVCPHNAVNLEESLLLRIATQVMRRR